MIYPGYLLNPGDMFQVEPERVLYATGAPKDVVERRATRRLRQKNSPSTEDKPETDPEETTSPENPAPTRSPAPEKLRKTLTELLKKAKSVVATPSADLTARRKHDIRAFQQTLKRTLSRTDPVTGSLEQQYLDMAQNLNISLPEVDPEPDASDSPPVPVNAKKLAISDAEKALLKQAMADARSNPVDPSKPYATPWRPRDYMSVFAFIPKYLEVHHRVCSAVYLRHPVARPGAGEVPTPYGVEFNSLVFSWYLRRR